MAEKLITRTVATTSVTVLGLNPLEQAAETRCITLVGDYEDFEKALKAIPEAQDFIAVKVISTFKTESLYGMSEAEFLAHAKKLPPRKIYNQDAE